MLVAGLWYDDGGDCAYVDENFVPWRTTFSTASKKSRSVATFRRARIANMPASVATDRSSAPVVLGHSRAIKSKRMLRTTLILGNESQLHESACRE